MFNKKEYDKKYYQEHKAKILEQVKEYRLSHKQELINQDKDYYQSHKEIILKNKKEYYNKNKEKIIDRISKYCKIRKYIDINYKILCNLRTRLYLVLKNNPKSLTTIRLVGCSIKKLRRHLESKFVRGMSWDNYGKWHVDHIRPCASFDLSKFEEQAKCFNWKNLQPLWAKDNLSKTKQKISNKYGKIK
jgi:hypothetical protein